MLANADTITLDQMKGAIGSFLFLWSDIGRSLSLALQTELFRGNLITAWGISRSLDVWSERVMQAGVGRPLQMDLCQRLVSLLREALVVRNLVCHGLIGYSAQVRHRHQEAHLRVELGEDKRILTWDKLQTMFQWMSRSRWLIRDLTEAALEKDAAISEKFLRGWAAFPERL